jgi:hypothetical protein
MPDPKDRTRRATQRTATGPILPEKHEQRNMRTPAPTGLAIWWPVLVGVALGFFAPQIRDLVEPYDPWGMRAVFPFVQFFGLREIGMSEELTRTLPQLMLYLQFPLEGLLTKFTLGRGVHAINALAQLVFLHVVAALVLWIVALGTAG